MFKSFAAVAVTMAALVLGGSVAANASTSGVLPFTSNTVVNVNGVDFFQVVNPVVGSPVTAGPADTADNNFAASWSGPNSVRFNVVGTNLCVADPGPGYGHVDNIVLRTCNGKQWQAFRVVQRNSEGFASLQSVATNQFVQDNGQLNNLTGVADNRPCTVGLPCPAGTQNVNLPTGTDNQLWRFGHNLFLHRHPRLSATQSQSAPVTNPDLTQDSVTYTYTVTNNGHESDHVNVSATEVLTATVTGVGTAGTNTTAGDGTYTMTLSQNVATNQVVLGHGVVTDTNKVSLADPGSMSNVTDSNGYDANLAKFLTDLKGTKAHVSVSVVETPTVLINRNGHYFYNVDVTPATETVTIP